MLNRGTVGDRQVVPSAWLDDIFDHPGDPEWTGYRLPDASPYYRSFVWGLGDGTRAVTARGVHGQYLYVAPLSNIVIAMVSSWPNADGGVPDVGLHEAMTLLRAVEAAVR